MITLSGLITLLFAMAGQLVGLLVFNFDGNNKLSYELDKHSSLMSGAELTAGLLVLIVPFVIFGGAVGIISALVVAVASGGVAFVFRWKLSKPVADLLNRGDLENGVGLFTVECYMMLAVIMLFVWLAALTTF